MLNLNCLAIKEKSLHNMSTIYDFNTFLFVILQVFNGSYSLSQDNSTGLFELEESTPPSELGFLYLSIRLVNLDGLEDGELYYLQVSHSNRLNKI